MSTIDMASTIWTLPVPSTAILQGVKFEQLLGRNCALTFDYEGNDDEIVHVQLTFEDVEAYKCTYLYACTVELIGTAYDKVVDVGSSEWLTAIRQQLVSYGRDVLVSFGHNIDGLKHLMIFFDDGPCYEFVCRALRVEETGDDTR
ncbi:MAG: hypothetical protein ND895_09915 [Pyrinomonadaceae bacterium]|nr:hypothetical protein [Pyrinomonadaceae bacterium]